MLIKRHAMYAIHGQRKQSIAYDNMLDVLQSVISINCKFVYAGTG